MCVPLGLGVSNHPPPPPPPPSPPSLLPIGDGEEKFESGKVGLGVGLGAGTLDPPPPLVSIGLGEGPFARVAGAQPLSWGEHPVVAFTQTGLGLWEGLTTKSLTVDPSWFKPNSK